MLFLVIKNLPGKSFRGYCMEFKRSEIGHQYMIIVEKIDRKIVHRRKNRAINDRNKK